MTSRQQKALQRYVDKLLPKFGLDWWTIVVQDVAPPKGCLAHFFAVHGQRYGLLKVDDDLFWDLPAEDQRQTVVHELLHAHSAPADYQMQNVLKDVMVEEAYTPFYATWLQQTEYSVDHLANVLAPFFPLPELP